MIIIKQILDMTCHRYNFIHKYFRMHLWSTKTMLLRYNHTTHTITDPFPKN